MQSIVKKTTATIDSYLFDGKTWLDINADHPEVSFKRFKNRYNYLLSLGRISQIPGIFRKTGADVITVNTATMDSEDNSVSPISQVEADFVAKEQGLIEKINHLRREKLGLAKVAAAKNEMKTLIQETAWALKKLPHVPVYEHNPDVVSKKGTFVLCLHDIHIGQQTYSAFGNYDITKFQERCHTLTAQVLEILKPYVERGDVQDLIILFGGDLVDGRNVYPGHAVRSSPRNVQFAVGLEYLSKWLINVVAKSFPDLKIQCLLTVGNHGRYGGKEEFFRVEDSDDFLFYQMLMERCRMLSNVTFHLPNDWWTYFQIYDWKIFAEHGDALKNVSGLPLNVIKQRREITSNLMKNTVDMYIMGHIHTSIQAGQGLGYQIVNGCWPGTSEYSARLGYTSPPLQKLLYVTPDNPLAASFEITLDNNKELYKPVQPSVLVKEN